jgi:histidine ammonia-lyase
MTRSELELDGRRLTLADLAACEHRAPRTCLSEEARERLRASVAVVEDAVRTGRTTYGVNTGFGAFANRRISPAEVRRLQVNLVRSHACGVGPPLPPHLVRQILLLKANALAAGHSGVREIVVEGLLALLERDVLPRIPSKGSVGASGDLAPLAHVALALIGEGEADCAGQLLEGTAVCEAAGMAPLELAAKEGLALLNGTQLSLALAADGLLRADRLLTAAIAIGALTVEGLAGSYTPFDERIHAVSRLSGQIEVARRLRDWLTESEIHRSHEQCDRVQDPYAVRCMPQVLGAIHDTLEHARSVLAAAINGVSDNPLVFDPQILSGGNFHAQPIAFVCDFVAIATAEIGSMSERRTDLLDRRVNPALNMFLTSEPGLESGFMIAHVTAAALASENKTLAHPASVDSIPTSAGQEDHVSMAPWAGRKLGEICGNVSRILAIELLAAAQAIDCLAPLGTTAPLARLHAFVREHVPARRSDHRLDRDIEVLAGLIEAGALPQPPG